MVISPARWMSSSLAYQFLRVKHEEHGLKQAGYQLQLGVLSANRNCGFDAEGNIIYVYTIYIYTQ